MIFAELAAQVEIGSLEQGRLMRYLRRTYGMVYTKLSREFSDSLWSLETSATALLALKSSLADLTEAKEASERSFEGRMADLREVNERVKVECNERIKAER